MPLDVETAIPPPVFFFSVVLLFDVHIREIGHVEQHRVVDVTLYPIPHDDLVVGLEEIEVNGIAGADPLNATEKPQSSVRVNLCPRPGDEFIHHGIPVP